MYVTEEDAAKMWCPHAVASHTDPRRGFSGGLADQHGATFPCIGSRCMAWRWGEKDREKCFHSHGPAPDPEVWERVSPVGGAGVWPTYRRKSSRGFCGLAGEPK